MDRDEALVLLKGGEAGIQEWNRRRDQGEPIPSLQGADFSNANLREVDLTEANLRDADLSEADLRNAELGSADLRRANLHRSDLSEAELNHADLRHAHIPYADLTTANLRHAILRHANLFGTVFNYADLTGADFRDARLLEATLIGDATILTGANFTSAHLGWTTFAGCDLSDALGLDAIVWEGPCTVGHDTLTRAKGVLPDEFLRGCGMQPWEILSAKLYDPALTPAEINDLQYKIFDARSKGFVIGGVFISYSHADSPFVDKVYARLQAEGIPVWLDRHDAVAGPLQTQIDRAIRLNDVMLLVLSKSSVDSDWVEHELDMARRKEKDEGRDVLCPVALDDAWKAKLNDVLWRQIKKKNVLDFSKWKTRAFDPQFQKLLKGMKIYYGPGAKAEAPTTGTP